MKISNYTKFDYTKSKKSQIQMGETVAIVIIVMILLVVGIVFWNKLERKDIVDNSRSTDELFVIEISNTISELPELKCSKSLVQQPNCFDLYKILALNYSINGNADPVLKDTMKRYYTDYFRTSKITFQQVYPTTFNITIYDYEMVNATRTHLITVPITIEDTINKRTGFGVIYVEGYIR